MPKFAITISRQYGSGGRIVGEKLSKELNASFYDKELIQIAAKKSGLGEEIFKASDEKPRFWLAGEISGLLHFLGGYSSGDNMLLNDSLFRVQSSIISQLARKESCVFIGRCADYVLRLHQNIFNVFICADFEDRVSLISKKEGVSREKAETQIRKIDKERAKYYEFYAGRTWSAPQNYHLCVNTSALGIEQSAEFILNFARKKIAF